MPHHSHCTPDRELPLDQLRNIGPVCQRELNAVGIFTSGELIDLGAEAALLRLVTASRQQGKGDRFCHAGYLYALYGAIHGIDWRAVPESQKRRFKKFTAELRGECD